MATESRCIDMCNNQQSAKYELFPYKIVYMTDTRKLSSLKLIALPVINLQNMP